MEDISEGAKSETDKEILEIFEAAGRFRGVAGRCPVCASVFEHGECPECGRKIRGEK